MLVRAIGAGVVTRILAERRFVFRQGLAAILTLNGFHRALLFIVYVFVECVDKGVDIE